VLRGKKSNRYACAGGQKIFHSASLIKALLLCILQRRIENFVSNKITGGQGIAPEDIYQIKP